MGGRTRGKVNYNVSCDLDRFEKFRNTILSLAGVKKATRLAAVTIKEMPKMIPCSQCCIFVLQNGLMNNKQFESDPSLILQKAVVDGRYID